MADFNSSSKSSFKSREDSFYQAFKNGDNYPIPVTLEEERNKDILQSIESRMEKVNAPQYLLDENDKPHWNTGKYKYISMVHLGKEDDSDKRYIYFSHEEPLIWCNTTLALPNKYEVIEGELPEDYSSNWVVWNIDGYWGYMDDETPLKMYNDYDMFPEIPVPNDVINTDQFFSYGGGTVTYKGRTYNAWMSISQQIDPMCHNFIFLLTELGLVSIVFARWQTYKKFPKNACYEYNAESGTIHYKENLYKENTFEDPYFEYLYLQMKVYDPDTGKSIDKLSKTIRMDAIANDSFYVGKNILKYSTNTLVKNLNWGASNYDRHLILNSFDDVDEEATNDSFNHIRSGGVYKSIDKVKPFIFSVDTNGSTTTTFVELLEAYNAGKQLICEYTSSGASAITSHYYLNNINIERDANGDINIFEFYCLCEYTGYYWWIDRLGSTLGEVQKDSYPETTLRYINVNDNGFIGGNNKMFTSIILSDYAGLQRHIGIQYTDVDNVVYRLENISHRTVDSIDIFEWTGVFGDLIITYTLKLNDEDTGTITKKKITMEEITG